MPRRAEDGAPGGCQEGANAVSCCQVANDGVVCFSSRKRAVSFGCLFVRKQV